MKRSLIAVLIVIFAMTLLVACHKKPTVKPPGTVEIPTLSHVSFVYAIYFSGELATDPLNVVRLAMGSQRDGFIWNEAISATTDGIFVECLPAREFEPPDKRSLSYFGRGLDADDIDNLSQSKRVFVLHFACKMQPNYQYLLGAERLAYLVAVDAHGFLWDDSARLMYSPQAFKNMVLDHWQEGLPSVRRDISIHLYADGELMRAVSLGMEKFGKPNLVVNQISRSSSDSAVTLMTVVGQQMIEQWPSPSNDPFDVNLDRIRNSDVQTWVLPTLQEGASRHEIVRLSPGIRQEGDAAGLLYEFTFAGEKGASLQERQEALIGRLFGSQDELVNIKHDDAILELSRQARVKLKSLKPQFLAGLKPGERLLVKGPFKAGSQTEWMWIEVTRWDGDLISGILQNDPVYVTSLKAGARTSIAFDEAFDYLFVRADGIIEGNETGEFMKRQQEK